LFTGKTGKSTGPHEVDQLEFDDPQELSERQVQRHVEIEGKLRVRQTAFSEAEVIQEVIQMAAVLVYVNDASLSSHVSETVGHVFVELHLAEQSVEKPAQKKSRLEIQTKGMKVFLGSVAQRFEASLFRSPSDKAW